MPKQAVEEYNDTFIHFKRLAGQMMILKALQEQDLSAPDIDAIFDQKCDKRAKILNPRRTLDQLEKKGLIEKSGKQESFDHRQRLHFHITEKGNLYLREQEACIGNLVQDLIQFMDWPENKPPEKRTTVLVTNEKEENTH